MVPGIAGCDKRLLFLGCANLGIRIDGFRIETGRKKQINSYFEIPTSHKKY
jgi:hypothetical protein